MLLAFVALGAVGYLTYRLGALWFGVPAGLLAAVIILTREPVLSYGTRAYVDLPYLALVLARAAVGAPASARRSSRSRSPACCARRRGCSPSRCWPGAGGAGACAGTSRRSPPRARCSGC